MKQAMTTAVASLLTLVSVAIIPAFAQDTGGVQFRDPVKQQHERSGYQKRDDAYRHRGYGAKDYDGEREQYHRGEWDRDRDTRYQKHGDVYRYVGDRDRDHDGEREQYHRGNRY